MRLVPSIKPLEVELPKNILNRKKTEREKEQSEKEDTVT